MQQKEAIRQTLEGTLGQIRSMRAESARAKAAATLEAWQSYANQRAQLNLKAVDLSQNLMKWALEKGNSLKLAQEYALANTPQLNPSAFGITPPNIGMNTQNLSPYSQNIAITKRKQEENPLAKLGVLPSTVS